MNAADINKIIESSTTHGELIEKMDQASENKYADPVTISYKGEEYRFNPLEFRWGDGDGARMTFVFEVIREKDRAHQGFFQCTGTRSSWSDHFFHSDVTEVEPKEITITKYFPKVKK